MKILIVEDNPSMRRLIRQAIDQIAGEFIECDDGSLSLAAYAQHLPDLVLMDVRMPHMDGLTAMRLLLERYPDARVVILTDYNDEDLRSAAMNAGARAYALKHNLTELDEVLLEV